MYEQLPRLGGKLAEHRRDGFAFSLGPSLLTMPGLFRELGLDRELIEPDPLCRYRFADGTVLDARRDPGRMAAEVERLAPRRGAGLAGLPRLGQGRPGGGGPDRVRRAADPAPR
ncbi:FAD-dependent oxidoreductase [Nonomuraea ferruginea]